MPKEFKRRESGGSFKKPNFGDLGLQAYKNQQEQQIGALKNLQIRADQYSKQFITDFEGVARTEEENRRLLKSLEDNLWETRRRNVKKRGDREVESLRGEADELLKNSQFWSEFAPKFAGELLEAGVAVGDALQRHESIEQIKEFEKEAEEITKGLSNTQETNITTIANERTEALKNKDYDVSKYLGKALNGSNKYTQAHIVSWIKDHKEVLFDDVETFVVEQLKLPLTPENIRRAFDLRYRELIYKFGVGDKTEGGQQIKRLFQVEGLTRSKRAQGIKDNKDATHLLESQLITFKNGRETKVFHNILQTLQEGQFPTKGGGFRRLTPGEVHTHGLQKIAPYFDDRNAFIEFAWDAPTAGQTITAEDFNAGTVTFSETLGQRYKNTKKNPNSEAAKRAELGKIWDDHNSIKRAEERKTLIAEGSAAIIKLNHRLNGTGEYAEGQKLAGQSWKGWESDETKFIQVANHLSEGSVQKYAGLTGEAKGSNVAAYLSEKIGYQLKPGSYSPLDIETRFLKAIAGGDDLELFLTYKQMSSDQQKKYETKYRKYSILKQGGASLAQIKKQASTYVKTKLKINTVDQLQGTSALRAAQRLEQVFIYEFEQLDEKDYINASGEVDAPRMVNAAWQNAAGKDSDFDKEEGLFETRSPASQETGSIGNKVWTFGETSTNQALTPDQAEPLIGNIEDEISLETILKMGNFVSKDDTKYLANHLTREKTIIPRNLPENLVRIAEVKNLPIEDVVNKWLELQEYDIRMTRGIHGWANDKSQVVTGKNITNQSQLDTASIGAWYAFADTGGNLSGLVSPKIYAKLTEKYNVRYSQ